MTTNYTVRVRSLEIGSTADSQSAKLFIQYSVNAFPFFSSNGTISTSTVIFTSNGNSVKLADYQNKTEQSQIVSSLQKYRAKMHDNVR